MLWDTGATHTIISPRIARSLGLQVSSSEGPTVLSMADDHQQECLGKVDNIQLLVGNFRTRLSVLVAEIGNDDVIIGNDILEARRGGLCKTRAGFWELFAHPVEMDEVDPTFNNLIQVPLIRPLDAESDDVQRITGVKKIRKFFREHASHMRMVMVRKVDCDEPGKSSPASQDGDAERFGEDDASGRNSGQPARQSSDFPRMRRALRRHLRRHAELNARVAEETKAMKIQGDQIKAELLQEFPDLFVESDKLPPMRWQNHRIQLEEDAQLPRARGLPKLSHAEIEETRNLIMKFLQRGWLVPSQASYGAPLFFVPKAGGKGLRAVADYREINKITKKILPSLPLMENILTEIEDSKFFSSLDCAHQFYQIRVEEKDVPLTSMRTVFGTYAWRVCPMGMTGSVGTAMSVMEAVLNHVISLPGETLPENKRTIPPLPAHLNPELTPDETWKLHRYHSALGSYCTVFIDDLLIHSKNHEDHLRHVKQICATLQQHKLYLNIDKCCFYQPEVVYLGNRIGRYGIRPTEERTEALRTWPTPKDISELRSFLGLCGFIRRWIPDFAQVASPLHALLKKGVQWDWTEQHDRAFDEMRIRCATPPVLAIPSRSDSLVVRCDASREAMGIALYRKDVRGLLQPIEYKSKAFAECQKKLPAHDRECLALLYALKSFRHFLLHKEFEVQTDNSALAQILTSRDLSDLYARWYDKISQFEGMKIVHRPGSKMYCADALSRRRSTKQDDSPFEIEAGVLSKVSVKTARLQLVRSVEGACVKVTSSDLSQATTVKADEICGESAAFQAVTWENQNLQELQRDWPALYQQDPDLQDIWRAEGSERWSYFKLNGLLWKAGPSHARLCIPAGADKLPFLQAMHDSKTGGHLGERKTLAKMQDSYYWKGMYSDVVSYVRSCQICQLRRSNRQWSRQCRKLLHKTRGLRPGNSIPAAGLGAAQRNSIQAEINRGRQ